jgi:hypothetical protein
LLGVAEAARSDQHDRSLRRIDGLFQRPDPGQARRQPAAVEVRLQPLCAQEGIDLRSVAAVGPRVTDENIAGFRSPRSCRNAVAEKQGKYTLLKIG